MKHILAFLITTPLLGVALTESGFNIHGLGWVVLVAIIIAATLSRHKVVATVILGGLSLPLMAVTGNRLGYLGMIEFAVAIFLASWIAHLWSPKRVSP